MLQFYNIHKPASYFNEIQLANNIKKKTKTKENIFLMYFHRSFLQEMINKLQIKMKEYQAN